MFVQTKASLLASLADIKAVLGVTGKIRLFSNDIVPSVNSVVGDFTECNFTGYSAVDTIGLAATSWQSQGAAVCFTDPQAAFNTASPYTVGQTVYGYYYTAGTTPDYLIGAERFTTPKSMIGAGDQIIVSAPVSISDGGIPGAIY